MGNQGYFLFLEDTDTDGPQKC